MIIFGPLLVLVGISFVCWLLFTLAVFALPFFVALTIGTGPSTLAPECSVAQQQGSWRAVPPFALANSRSPSSHGLGLDS
ncbi:hypothetical protein [Bradyrhizobium nanningense]|uniref:hypothetical protein n=1 Tax=Bradyrhizobium TaxID=374 RepID=UPI003D3195AC